jgi:hypothetical protein
MTDLYVLLVFDGVYLFVPQNEVESVEIIADVQITRTDMGAVGWFFGHGLESPVFCLAKDFSLLLDTPKNREYFVLLKTEQQPLGITCDEVENIKFKQAHLYPQDLPMAMKTPDSPISQLVVYQEKIGYICRGEALVRHLNLQSERFSQLESSSFG